MFNNIQIKEYYRLICVRLSSEIKNKKTLKDLIYSMNNDHSPAIRFAARKALGSFHNMNDEDFLNIERYDKQFEFINPPIIYYLNHLYPISNHYRGYTVGLLPTHWWYHAFGHGLPPVIEGGDFKLEPKQDLGLWNSEFLEGGSLVENNLVLGTYNLYEWQFIKQVANGRFFIAEGKDAKQWQEIIRLHPHFVLENKIIPSYIIRGQIKMNINNWGDYPDTEAVQSTLDWRQRFIPWKDHHRYDSFQQTCKKLKFNSKHFMQFSSVDGEFHPGVLRLVNQLEPGLWKAELHFPSEFEMVKDCVNIERTCQWYEGDLTGNWLKKIPGKVICESSKVLGIFTRVVI